MNEVLSGPTWRDHENATSSAVIDVPSQNVTSSRIVNVHVSGSGLSHAVAIQGSTEPSLPVLSRRSNAAVWTRNVGTSPALAGSIEPGGDWIAHTIVDASPPASGGGSVAAVSVASLRPRSPARSRCRPPSGGGGVAAPSSVAEPVVAPAARSGSERQQDDHRGGPDAAHCSPLRTSHGRETVA
jgi:hypothetical protein